MEIEELRPKPIVLSPPPAQCQAPVWVYRSKWDVKKFEERDWDIKKCSNGQSVKIDGVGYCRQHAGSVAIDKLIEEGRAEK